MTTPTDTAKLADEIEGLAKEKDAIGAVPPTVANHERKLKIGEKLYRSLPDIVAALRERDALKDEVERLRRPEWFYNWDDGEYVYGDVSDTVDDMGYEGVMRVAGAREVWNKWAAVKCVALDADGEVDETEVHTFDTEAEALRCWPDSLAACRARAALGGAG